MFGFFKLAVDDIKPEKEFGSTKVCSKCGGKKFKRTFVPYSTLPDVAVYYQEHIEAICKTCGAAHWEKCKDSE